MRGKNLKTKNLQLWLKNKSKTISIFTGERNDTIQMNIKMRRQLTEPPKPRNAVLALWFYDF